jgi:hypothetical protein
MDERSSMDQPSRKTSKKGEVVKPPQPIDVKAVQEDKKLSETVEVLEIKKLPKIKKVPIVKKAPKEIVRKEASKTKKEPSSMKKETFAEGKSLRSRQLHSLLDDLIKSRQDVLNTTTMPDQSTNTTIDNT